MTSRRSFLWSLAALVAVPFAPPLPIPAPPPFPFERLEDPATGIAIRFVRGWDVGQSLMVTRYDALIASPFIETAHASVE